MPVKIELRKACDCQNATASGPRHYTLTRPLQEGGWYVDFGIAEMVCDKCDTPWEFMERKAPDAAEEQG